ncbi:MAG: acyl-CoA dehydrogenase family protein [Promethearchaeota archaeon]|jgi:alkylation response protein AidB-like acyl-CoA dehydrogenase
MSEKKRYETQVISDEILEKLSLENRYKFVRENLEAILSEQQFSFLKQAQNFCLDYESKNNIKHSPDEDIYDWVSDFGKEGYITRQTPYSCIDLNYEDYGMAIEFMRILALDNFDPQFAMSTGATVICLNPIYAHHENVPIRLEALKELVTGQEVGCLLITEPERGSDAVHQMTTCTEQEDGSFILNGTKIFNTNAPKAKWAVSYATAEENNGNLMGQFLINTSWSGWSCERVGIPWTPKLFIGKEKLENLKIPKEYVLGGIGKGREHLFEGLIPERIAIAVRCMSACWGALAHAVIYANMRRQFDKEILLFQGVGFSLADLWAKTAALTHGILKFAETYDEKNEKYKGDLPDRISQSMVSSASQYKYNCANLAKDVCFETANLMGGAGVCDNTLMQDYISVSRILEVVGGTKQVQQLIMSRGLRRLFKSL